MPDDTAIEVIPAAPITLFGTDDPEGVIARASVVATALAGVVKRRQLSKRIGQSDHVFVEGWTLLGSMLGVFAEVEWSRPVEGSTFEAWEARAVARTLSGRTVGAAEAMCSRSESKWAKSDEYAIRSMAQTRAVSKALRLPLGFIMELAGYSATPAEEMPNLGTDKPDKGPPLGMLRARLAERAEEHGLDVGDLADIIDTVSGGLTIGQLDRDALIALGTAITRGDYDAREGTDTPAEATTPQGPSGDVVGPEQMGADEALQAGLALVKPK